MTEIRRQPSPSEKVVVRGGPRLVEVWPAERTDLLAPAPVAAEVRDVDAVVELLAAVEGDDPAAYGARYRQSHVALRALTAHCRAAILQAAARVHGEASPEAVLTEVHAGLQAPFEPLTHRLAS